jgi:hypothetical protein
MCYRDLELPEMGVVVAAFAVGATALIILVFLVLGDRFITQWSVDNL